MLRSAPDPHVLHAFDAAARGFAEALAGVTDPGVRIPQLTWTIGELGAHVLAGLRSYGDLLEGAAPLSDGPHQFAAANARQLELLPDRDPSRLSFQILESAAALKATASTTARTAVNWHGDLKLTVDQLVGVSLCELLVHGWDLDRVARSGFRISERAAIAAIEALSGILPAFVSPAAADVDAVFALRLRGGPSMTLAFHAGSLSVRSGLPSRADCHVSADPAAFLLSSFKRLPLWRPAVAGSIVCWGRRPWLGLRLPSMFLQA